MRSDVLGGPFAVVERRFAFEDSPSGKRAGVHQRKLVVLQAPEPEQRQLEAEARRLLSEE